MAYFKINNIDFSMYTNELKINRNSIYSAQANAAGDTVVDFQNNKYEIEVGIIPLDDSVMKQLLTAIEAFNVSITFRNPTTGILDTINCIIPKEKIEYYTIQAEKVSYKAFNLKFEQL